jgi:hypothetical protein
MKSSFLLFPLSYAYQTNIYFVDPGESIQTVYASKTFDSLKTYKLVTNNYSTMKEETYLKIEMIDHTAKCSFIMDQLNVPSIPIAESLDICKLPYVQGEDFSGTQFYTAMFRIDGTIMGDTSTMKIECKPYSETNWITRNCPTEEGNWLDAPPYISNEYFDILLFDIIKWIQLGIVMITNLSQLGRKANSGCTQTIFSLIDWIDYAVSDSEQNLGDWTNADTVALMFDSGAMYISTMVTDCIYESDIYSPTDALFLDLFEYDKMSPGFSFFPDSVYFAVTIAEAVRTVNAFDATLVAGLIESVRLLRLVFFDLHLILFAESS